MTTPPDVLITRPVDQSDGLISVLAGLPVQVTPYPLLRIEPVAPSAAGRNMVMNLERIDHIIFVSRNAVRYGMPLLDACWPQYPLSLQWFAVGPATGSELASWVPSVRIPDAPSTEGLLAMPELQSVESMRVLIVRGVGGLELLAKTLANRGAQVDYLEVYRRVAEQRSTGELNAIIGDNPLSYVMITSAQALEVFTEIAVKTGKLRQLEVIVPSERLRGMALGKGYQRVHLAAGATDELMVACLENILHY